MESSEARHIERTAEEIAWDEEFKDERQSSSLAGDLQGLARFAVRVPVALAQAATDMVPEETARHARAAAREGFLAVRTLMGAVGDRIEEMLQEPGTTTAGDDAGTVKGPPGTWGSGRTASGKVKRIEVDDD